MRPISVDVRKLVIRAKGHNKTVTETAHLYDVSPSSVKRLCRLLRETGNIEPKTYKGRPSRMTEEMIIAVIAKIESQTDITLVDIVEEMALPIGPSQLCKLLKKRDYSFKKKRFIPKHSKDQM